MNSIPRLKTRLICLIPSMLRGFFMGIPIESVGAYVKTKRLMPRAGARAAATKSGGPAQAV